MLKHRLKEPFGKAGLTVAILALVLAMVGGAYASGALSGKQRKEVEKIAKKSAGKPGANGAPGAPGTNGTNGTNGKDGAPGASGIDGVSVTSAPASAGECPSGGTKFTAANGTAKACNGEEGEEGPEGSPWTADGTLPPGKTETGTYMATSDAGNAVDIAFSFPIPLPSSLPSSHAARLPITPKDVEENEYPEGCSGSAAEPKAAAGYLCLFQGAIGEITSLTFVSEPSTFAAGAGITGALYIAGTKEPNEFIVGTWAVSAEE